MNLADFDTWKRLMKMQMRTTGKPIPLSDFQKVAQFGHELRALNKLIAEGHSRHCAQQRIWGEPMRVECVCLELREIQAKPAR